MCGKVYTMQIILKASTKWHESPNLGVVELFEPLISLFALTDSSLRSSSHFNKLSLFLLQLCVSVQFLVQVYKTQEVSVGFHQTLTSTEIIFLVVLHFSLPKSTANLLRFRNHSNAQQGIILPNSVCQAVFFFPCGYNETCVPKVLAVFSYFFYNSFTKSHHGSMQEDSYDILW